MPVPNALLVGEGLAPDGEPGRLFYVAHATADLIQETAPRWRADALGSLVHQAIRAPDVIFGDLKRAGYDVANGWAYCLSKGDDYVFIAYVTMVSGGGLMVFDWGERPEAMGQKGHPVNHAEAFGDVTWRRP